MADALEIRYTTQATAAGGRDGSVATSDGRLAADLDLPTELGGGGGPGTNPEQLFACGYSACFLTALHTVGQGTGGLDAAQLTAEVSLGTTSSGDFRLVVTLDLDPGDVAQETAAGLMHRAHLMCPYSRAIDGNVDVTLRVGGKELGEA